MRYHELIEKLRDKYEIESNSTTLSPEILDVRLLDGSETLWNEQVLYIGTIGREVPDCPIMLLSGDDAPILPTGSYYGRIRKEDLCSLFNTAKDLVFEDLKADVYSLELLQMALKGKNITKIMNAAAKILGNALILVDSGQKVIAHSTIYKIMDPLWAQNIKRGYCSYEFLQRVRANRQMKEWVKHGRDTQIITLSGDLQPKLVGRITHEGHLAGALIMIAHHTKITHLHFRLLPLIGKILFNTFFRNPEGEFNNSQYSTILYNLLDEAEVPDTLELIDISKISFPPKMHVVVARFNRPIENRYFKCTIRMELERIFPKGHSVQYKSYIIVVVSSISQKQKKDLFQLAKNEDISIGISWPFTDIMEFKRYFRQAVAAIKQAENFNLRSQVFDYTDFSYYDLLHNYTGKKPLKYYCHPALVILRQYDKTNNTELYITLKTYLDCNKNLSETAQTLFIHRNTLAYRLKRINELIELDLNIPTITQSLLDSFRIEEFLNQKNREEN